MHPLIFVGIGFFGGIAFIRLFVDPLMGREPFRLDDEETDGLPQEGELERSIGMVPKSQRERFQDGWKVEGHA